MRKILVYLMIMLLVFPQNPISISANDSKELDDEEVVLLSEHENEEISAFSSIDSIEENVVDYFIEDGAHAYLPTDIEDAIVEINEDEYNLILYETNIEEDSLQEFYVASDVIVPLDLEESYKTERAELEENEIETEDLEESDLGMQDEKNVNEDANEDKESSDSIKQESMDEKLIEEEANEVEESEVSKSNKINTFSVQSKAIIKESKVSKLGHIRSGNAKIYKAIGGDSFTAGNEYTNAVYYIKKQAIEGKDTYYLLSTQPSDVNGVVGWVNAKDLSTHDHVGIDKKSKTFYLNGKGKATTKAWGGKKDNVHSNLSKYEGESFQVNLTEKVGNNTWYRGKINGKGNTVWVHSSSTLTLQNESKISKLGHIRSANAKIYKTIGGSSITAGSQYTNAVYYIKKQAKEGANTYYLISTQPSDVNGVIGWVNAKDLSTHDHVGVDKKTKTFYLNGKGKATTKAWGGEKDDVHSTLSSHKHKRFVVNLTEKVGNNTWYRGKINGQGNNVWVHSSYVSTLNQSKTSKLGHIRSNSVKIYKTMGGSSITAGSQYTNAVYYIKKQAKIDKDTYYLISTQPSDVNGVIGWVNAKDLSTHDHKGVDKKVKTFYIKGNGKATSKAWGGSKDNIYSSLKAYQGEFIEVNLTEKVGNNTWYRGKLNGKGQNIWVHSSYVTQLSEKNTAYNLGLSEAVNIQYARPEHNANTKKEMETYLNPNNFKGDPKQKFQFLDLSKPSGISPINLNKLIKNRGTLHNQGNAFYQAARTHGINEVYLISHAILETGHGTSTLASGVEVGYNNKNQLTLVTASNRKTLTKIKTTYNMFGIGAVDNDALRGGAITAYQNGWFSPSAAIQGGAKWIRDGYITNQHNQNTLYKMKWNPNMVNGYAWKQYATDIGWASKQAVLIYNAYSEVGFPTSMAFDYPVYK